MSDDPNKDIFGGDPADKDGQVEPEITPTEPEPADGEPDDTVVFGDDPAGEPGGEPEPTDDDDAKKRAAFYQDRHQKTMQTLKELDPSLYHAIREQYREPEPGPKEPEPGVVVGDIDADFDPRELMRKLDNLPKAIEEAATKAQRDAVLRDRYAQETSSVEQKLAGFVKENKVPEDELKAAFREVQMLGIDTSQLGGPSAAARALVKELQYGAVMRHTQGDSTEAAAKATAQAKATLLASQPGAGAAPTLRSKSEKEAFLNKMESLGSSDVKEEIFGKK